MSRPYFLGIDPGLKGAIALYDGQPPRGLKWVVDMPVHGKKSGRKDVDAEELGLLIGKDAKAVRCAVIENVGAMTYIDQYGQKRGQGAASSFAFGKATGVVIGVLGALLIPTISVQPAVWKALLGLDSNKDKSRLLAMKKFPGFEFGLKSDDGKAEASLLAFFGAERFS